MDPIQEQNIVRLHKEKLNMLLEVAQVINEEHSIEELMTEFETLLHDSIGVTKILVYTKTGNHWNNILTSGVSAKQAALVDVNRDLAHINKIETLAMTENEALAGFDAIIPLYHKFKPIGYVLVGDDDTCEGISPTLKNLKFIQILCNLIVVFIESQKAQEKLMKQQAFRNELKLASQIQAGLIPSENDLATTSHTKIASLYRPHQDVGGDYYDVLKLSPYSLGFCIADVSGKGISAALLMSNFQAMVRSLFTAHIPLDKLVKELNQRICHNVASNDKFITFFVGRYNMLTGMLSYVNAGHLAPIVYDAKTETITELQDGCIALGMLDCIPTIEVGDIHMSKGNRLVTFTDGLVELDEGSYVSRSLDNVKKIMCETKNITDAMSRISAMADDNEQNSRVFDDVSVLGIEFVKNGFFSLYR
ncbi:MAG: serine/threonine-protein phosphatase [Bacteroidales bacterium]|nr:serine/threonine-protein phosphatase [Bacteroidales bacterium]